MVRTVVCEKSGCCGSIFYINNEDNDLILKCKICDREYKIQNLNYEFLMLSNCSKCNNDNFKVFKDTDKGVVYAKCIECGSMPEKVYINLDGEQVSYEEKLLIEIKEMIYSFEQKLFNLEVKFKNIENGQNMLEQSLAYINKYIIEKV